MFFKKLFMQQLPDDIQAHLARSQISDYRELPQAADELWMSRSTSNMHPQQRRVVKEKSPVMNALSPSLQTSSAIIIPDLESSHVNAVLLAIIRFRKRPNPSSLASMAAGEKNTLLFVLDRAYGRQFLIDT